MSIRMTTLFTVLTFSFSCSNSTPDTNKLGRNLFTTCTDSLAGKNYKTLQHDLFQIDYPANWKEDSKLKQGLDISSTDFPDSLQRGFMLSVVPYQAYYLKENKLVDYHRFETGKYNGYDAIYLTRNDLQPREQDNTVYWRSELKLVDSKEEQIYILVFGKRHEKEGEPDWCEFERIIKSLKIKE